MGKEALAHLFNLVHLARRAKNKYNVRIGGISDSTSRLDNSVKSLSPAPKYTFIHSLVIVKSSLHH